MPTIHHIQLQIIHLNAAVRVLILLLGRAIISSHIWFRNIQQYICTHLHTDYRGRQSSIKVHGRKHDAECSTLFALPAFNETVKVGVQRYSVVRPMTLNIDQMHTIPKRYIFYWNSRWLLWITAPTHHRFDKYWRSFESGYCWHLSISLLILTSLKNSSYLKLERNNNLPPMIDWQDMGG